MADHIEKVLAKAVGDAFDKAFQPSGHAQTALRDAVKGMGKTVTKEFNQAQAVLDKFSQESYNLVHALQLIGSEAKVISASLLKARTLSRASAITERQQLDADNRTKIAQIKAQDHVNFVNQQRQLIRDRQVGQRRILILQETLRTMGRLEKGFAAVVSGVARTTTSAFSRAFSGIGSALTRSNRQFSEGVATSLRTRESLVSRSMLRQERLLEQSVTRQRVTIERLNRQVSTGALGAITGRGVGGGLLGGLAIGGGAIGLLTSGFQRFSDLERINKQFVALTGNVDDANRLLAEARQFAKETPFDLVGVADLAKGFLAIKTPVDQVLPRVKAIADAVALTGGGVEELNRIQRAIGQIVSTGKLQGDELNQLAENLPGLNIRQILADQLTGGDVQALVALQEAGKLSADSVVNGLITGLQQDPRLVGASGDLAKTLGGRFANLKESFADFGASIIGTVVGPLKAAVTTTQTILQTLADFIKGEGLSPALNLVRDGLKGVAIALGLVFAARSGVETLKLLGVASKLLLTPFGTLLVIAGALGAAISVLSTRSEPFRKAMAALGDRLGALAASLRSLVMPILDAFASFLSGTVLPAVDALGKYIGDHLLNAIDRTMGFITNTAIPAVRNFALYVGDLARNGFGLLVEKATAFFNVVRPYIQPAIDGFRELGRAIGSAFGGDFSGLRSGAASALSGLGSSIALIAGAVGEALAPVAQRVLEFFRDLFSPPNIKRYVSGFLGFVEEVGRIIGSVVSHPAFIAAVAGIGAAAAVVAFRFVEGFARGVVDHLDDLARIVGNAFVAAIGKVFSSPALIVALLASPTIIAGLVRRFRGAGEQAGKAMAQGAATGFSGRAKAGGQFLSTLFSGADGTDSLAASKRFWKGQGDLAQSYVNRLRMLGVRATIDTFGKGWEKKPKELIKTLERGLTAAELAALKFRDTLRNIGNLGSGIGSGLGRIFAGIRDAFSNALSGVRGGVNASGKNLANLIFSPGDFSAYTSVGAERAKFFAGGFRDGLRRSWGTIRDGAKQIGQAFTTFFQEQGTTAGKFWGAAFAKSVNVALAGVGGFMAGRAAGQAGGSGFGTALLSGLGGAGGALALGASGGSAAVLGLVAAGASLIGSEIGASERAAKAAQERYRQLADSLKSELIPALRDGSLAAADFNTVLSNPGTRFTLGDTIAQTLKPSTVARLNDLGLGIRDVVGAFARGDDAVRALIKRVSGGTDEINANSLAAIDLSSTYSNLQKALRETQDAFDFNPRAARDLNDEAVRLAGNMFRAGKSVDEVNKALDAAGYAYRVNPPAKVAVEAVESAVSILDGVVLTATEHLKSLLNPGGVQSIDQAIISAAAFGQQAASGREIGGIVGDATIREAQRSYSELISGAIEQGVKDGTITDAATAKAVLQPIVDAFTQNIGDANLAALIQAQFDNAIPQIAVDLDTIKTAEEIRKNIPGVTKAVEDALNNNPQLRAALESFGGEGTLAGDAFVGNIVLAFGQNPAALSDSGSWIAKQIALGFALGLTGAQVQGIINAAAFGFADNVKGAISTQMGIASPSKVAMELGTFFGQGFALGITASTSDVTAAIDGMVDAALNAFTGSSDVTRSLASGLFSSLVGSNSPLNLAGKKMDAQAGVTTAMQSFLSSFGQSVSTVFDLAKKKPSELTAAEKDLLGESAFSLNVADVLGANNVSAFNDALEAIAKLGETLLAQGEDAGAVTQTLSTYVAQLVAKAKELGFSEQDLLSLVDQMGLSQSALADYVDLLNQASTSSYSGHLPGYSGLDKHPGRNGRIENHIYLPSGDPEAAAMAVANRQASWLFG